MEPANKEGHVHHHHHSVTPPWLLITDSSHNEKQYLYSISENRFHHLSANGVPELHDMHVLASAYGWLVLVHPKTDYTYIWNPISMDKIEIGRLKPSFLYNKCVMSKPPSEPDCHILFYSSCGIYQAFCRLVDEETVIPLHYHDSTYKDAYLMAAVSFRGKIYGVIDPPGYRFVTFDFGDGTVKYHPILKVDQGPWDMPDPTREWAFRTEIDMIESPCGQELLLVHKTYVCHYVSDEFDFRVFRVDVDGKECVELDSIGDRAIFLSHHGGGFCCSSSSATGIFRRNCIYYTVPKGKSRSVYVYDLNYRSTTLLLPCPAARRTQSVSYWIEKRVFVK